MGQYNLLDEKWIAVLRKSNGKTEKVSLKELFAHASDYYDLAGEMRTQDFAILRVLLAVLQTVFSRFDSEGNPYEMMEINEETFQQIAPLNQEELEDEDPLFETWLNLWKKGEFPEVVQNYLEAWRDHFNLFDEKFPFYQVTPEEMKGLVKENAKGEYGSSIYGKNINRTISESNNKIALFSPAAKEAKENLLNDQLVRWLIMYQGYSGASDKQKIELNKTPSIGWLYDLGGIFLKGHNLFETLMLNCILSTKFDKDLDDEELRIQTPCWEYSPLENVDLYIHEKIDNRASLYTSWSRAIAFDKNYSEGSPFRCFLGKLPKIENRDNFMEPMTCWECKKSEESNKIYFVPRKHSPEKAVWRHFNVLMGLGTEGGEYFQQPGILSWYHRVCENPSLKNLGHLKVKICSVSMKDDGNSSSRVVTDEIIDELQMETAVLLDTKKDGWIELINTLINESESRIKKTLEQFLEQIAEVRNYQKRSKHFMELGIENLYQDIDQAFRDWLYNLEETDSMNEKAMEWYSILKKAIMDRGDELFREASFRDFKGKTKNKTGNIATAYNDFVRNIIIEFS